MAILEIIRYGNPILREIAPPVESITKKDCELIESMLETMYHNKGVGLAAPQVGVSKRIFVADVKQTEEKGDPHPLIFINPEITAESEEDATFKEGCLSLPDVEGEVYRPVRISIKAYNKNLKPFDIEADKLLARIIQHEIDHLNGILFIDKIGKIKRSLIAGQINQIRKKTEEKFKNKS